MKPLMRALALILGAATLGMFGLAWFVDRFGQRDGARKADVIVVLGARVLAGGVPCGSLRARVEKAVQLYRAGLASRLLFSGGVGLHGPAEAQVMRRLAIELGVPGDACLVEENSHSTDENVRFSLQLLDRLGAAEIGVVSDPYHLLRARQHFRLHGREAWTSPASWAERNIVWHERCYWTLREAFILALHPPLLFRRPAPRNVAPA